MSTEVGRIHLTAILESSGLMKEMQNLGNQVSSQMSGLTTRLGQGMNSALGAVRSGVSSLASHIPAPIANAVSAMGGHIGRIGGFFSPLSGIARSAFSGMGQIAISAGSMMGSAMQRTAGVVGGAFSSMATWGRQLGAAVGIAGAAAFTALGVSAIKGAAGVEQTRIAIQAMTGSADVARNIMQQVTAFAAQTPFRFPELADSVRQLIAFGFSADDAIGSMKMLGNVAAGVGAPLSDIGYLYGTLRAQGRAYTVDIRQFANRGIPIYEYLARVLGVDVSKVKELVEAGKVGFPQVEQAFQLMTRPGEKFGSMMAMQSKSLKGLWSTLTDSIGIAVNQIIGISADGEVRAGSMFDIMRKSLAGAIDFLNQHLPTITKFFDTVVSGAMKLKGAFAGAAIGGVIALIVAAIAALWGPALAIIGIFAAVGLVVQKVIEHFGGMGNVINWLKGIWLAIKPAVDMFIGALQTLWGIFVSALMPVLEMLWGQLQKLWPTIVFLAKVIGAVLLVAVVIFVAILMVAIVIIAAVIAVVVWLANIIISVLVFAFNLVVTVVTFLWNVISTVFMAIWTVVSTVINIIVAIITTALSILLAIWTVIWNVIKFVLEVVFFAIMAIILITMNIIRIVITAALNVIMAVWGAIWGAIKAVASAVWGVIGPTVMAGVNFVLNIIRAVMSAAASVWGSIWGTIKGLVSGAINGIVGIVQGISRVAGIVGDAISSAYNAVKGWVGSFLSAGRSIIDAVVDGIRAAGGAIMDAIRAAAGPFAKFLPSSDAKDPSSPFHNLTASGRAIPETIAAGILQRKDAIMKAMHQATGGLGFDTAFGMGISADAYGSLGANGMNGGIHNEFNIHRIDSDRDLQLLTERADYESAKKLRGTV